EELPEGVEEVETTEEGLEITFSQATEEIKVEIIQAAGTSLGFDLNSFQMLQEDGGGNEGSNKGGNDGSNDGGNDGSNDGGNDGSNDGGNDGSNDGGNDGSNDGGNDGSNDGGNDGSNDGTFEGGSWELDGNKLVITFDDDVEVSD